ncbi:MAG: putative quinol monooxygenase [Gemmatimonadales bacterium]
MLDDSTIVVIRYTALPDRIEEATAALAELIAIVVREEEDCIGITMHAALDDPAQILLWEEWTSREAYQGPHMQTPHLRAFIDRAAERFAGPPEITFWARTAEAMPE